MTAQTQANRQWWDQRTREHQRADFYDLDGFRAGRERLRSIELSELGDVSGRSLLHLQCHFGLDTLAWARRGATVTGVDFSPRAIDLARALANELDIPAAFHCSDLYQLPAVLDGQFDIVFTSYGVLHWLPDLTRWGQIIARYLKPGGIFYIVEDHPFFRVLRPTADGRIEARRTYFHRPQPQRIEAAGSYATGNEGEAGTYYIWDHGLGEVINALLGAGLSIDFLREYPYAARAKFPFMVQGDDGWWRLPAEQHGTVPFLFSLQAHRPTPQKTGTDSPNDHE